MSKLTVGLRPNDASEVVRVIGGILIGVGMVLVAIRYLGQQEVDGNQPSNFKLFVIFGLPAIFLYAVGIGGRVLGAQDRRWQTVYTVFGMLLMPIALFFLVASIDESFDASLISMFIFGFCATACAFSWLIASVRFQLLLGSLYAAIAWFAFLDKVLTDGLENREFSTIRALLLAFAVLLVVAAFFVRRREGPEPEAAFGELLTGAGLTALIAYTLGPVQATDALNSGGPDRQEAIWDILTLLTGGGLVILGVGRGLRGPVYVGALMLLLFTISVGLDLDDETPKGTIAGWPLVVCILGAAAFLASLAPGRFPPALGGWYQGGREPLPAEAAAPAAYAATDPPTAPTQVSPQQPADTYQPPPPAYQPPSDPPPPPGPGDPPPPR